MYHVLFSDAMNCWCVFKESDALMMTLVCKAENKYRAEKYAKNIERNDKQKIEWRE